MGGLTYETLEHVAMEARAYPDEVLEGCTTGLALFSAAFLGHNDVVHFALAGIQTTCVDTDDRRLDEMAELYPEEWEFVTADAFEFIRQTDRTWDVVTIDPFTDKFDACQELLPAFCGAANRAVVIGTGIKGMGTMAAPDGWRITRTEERSKHQGGVFWVVLERA